MISDAHSGQGDKGLTTSFTRNSLGQSLKAEVASHLPTNDHSLLKVIRVIYITSRILKELPRRRVFDFSIFSM